MPDGESVILRYVDPSTKAEVVVREHNAYDAARQVNRITWRYATGEREDARTDVLDMRIFFPQELDALLFMHGFDVVEKYGDYRRAAFTSLSSKQIVVCRARG